MSKLPLSILLVEDHLAIARQVLDFLDGLGWQTDHAGTGALPLASRGASCCLAAIRGRRFRGRADARARHRPPRRAFACGHAVDAGHG